MSFPISVNAMSKLIKCKDQFDPNKEGNSNKRKCGLYCFGDSYYIRSKKEYKKYLIFAMIESQ